MSPSTCLHAFGDSKRAQPSHCRLSFGVSWYATVCLATLAALARLAVTLTIVAAPAALAAPCNNERRESFADQICDMSDIESSCGGVRIGNGQLSNKFQRAISAARFWPAASRMSELVKSGHT